MNNREIMMKLSTKLESGYSQSEVNEIVDAFVEIIAQTLCQGETVNITGIGKLSTKQQPERRYYNVHSRQMESRPTKRVVVFKPSAKLQNRLLSDWQAQTS